MELTRKASHLKSLALLCLTALSFAMQGCSAAKSGDEDGSIAESKSITSSPDNSLSVGFNLTDGKAAFYTVSKNDTLVLEPSKLGIKREGADFTSGLELEAVSEVEPVQDKYEIRTAKRRGNTYNANRRTYNPTNAGGEKMDIITDDKAKGEFCNATVDLGGSAKQQITLKPNGGFVMVF